MSCGLYKITCINNGKIYIGSSNNIEKRWILHLSRLRNGKHDNIIMQNCYDKYGITSLKIDIVLLCIESELIQKEQLLLNSVFDNQNACMNINAITNKPPSCKGKVLSNEHKHKISQSNKGKTRTEETKMKIRQKRLLQKCPRSGYVASEETKMKMSIANTSTEIKTLLSPTGEKVEFNNLSLFCRTHNLHKGHIGDLINGSRHTNSVKGWKRA